MSFGVMLLVMMGFIRVLISTSNASGTNHESTQAKQVARQMIETLAAEPFDTVFARYNGSRDDDPLDTESPGSGFVIEGLNPVDGDVDGMVGEIIFPTEDGGVLREDLELPALGLPMDLNADGDIDGLDHAGDYAMLPVQVRIQWDGVSGPGLVEFTTLIAND